MGPAKGNRRRTRGGSNPGRGRKAADISAIALNFQIRPGSQLTAKDRAPIVPPCKKAAALASDPPAKKRHNISRYPAICVLRVSDSGMPWVPCCKLRRFDMPTKSATKLKGNQPSVAVQCSAQSTGGGRVLLSCGDDFLKTDCASVERIIEALVRVLGEAAAFRLEAKSDLCQTILPPDTCLEKSVDASPPAPAPVQASYPARSRNRFPFRRPRNVVHLFSVVSYRDGWPRQISNAI